MSEDWGIVLDELEYLMTAANKPGVISHHDAEDAEERLRAALARLQARQDELEEDISAERDAHEAGRNLLRAAQARIAELEAVLREIEQATNEGKALGHIGYIARRALDSGERT